MYMGVELYDIYVPSIGISGKGNNLAPTIVKVDR